MEEKRIARKQMIKSTTHPDFEMIDNISTFLDNKFTIPFTRIKFGFDFLIGLIPTVGDWLSFGVSSMIIFSMVKRGVGIWVLFKMMGNVFLDATIGSIPILGDIFDLKFKANRRNMEMLKQYYRENPNPPDAKRSFTVVFILFIAIMVIVFYMIFKLVVWLWQWVAANYESIF